MRTLLAGTVPSLLCLCLAQARAGDGRDALKYLGLWKSGADAVWSYDIHIDVVVRGIDAGGVVTIGQHRIRQRYLHGKWRVDFLRTRIMFNSGKEEVWEAGDEIKAFADNGSGVRYFSSQDQFGELKLPGADPETRAKLPAPHLYEAFKSHYHREPYHSILEHRAGSTTVTIAPEQIKLRLPSGGVPVPHTHASEDYLVHLSPESGYQPTLIRHGVGLGKQAGVYTETENVLDEVAPGVWAPVRSTRRIFAPEISGNPDTPAAEHELVLDRSRSQFNVDIRPEVFEMAFPPGTVVYDKAKAANYVINEGGQADYDAYARLARQKAEELNARKLTAPIPARGFNTVLLVIANVLGLSAVALVVYCRKR
ncbi:hypothetical protein Mal4_52650 [Maioricimonas rarisocia]|uniref:DUF3068 domain-containing protein n=2 Tax=Maioricimonas rarisocia TaxID=2528026 RepID=A0A517ZEK6_9PLAN|nr:hypothetical protein Mal4_52650 [Maioricimonas rarisocia]